MQKTVAVMVHTFLRDDLMFRCIESILKFLPNAKIYLSDGGVMTTEKFTFYEILKLGNHYVKHYDEYNYWWRKAFNEKVELSTEDFILKIDDDFYFNDDSLLHIFPEVLEKQTEIMLIGGRVYHIHNQKDSPFIYNVIGIEDDKYKLKFTEIHENTKITHADFVPDFWIARRELFDDVKMDETLKPAGGGHEKFFLDIYESKHAGRVAYTPQIVAWHEKGTQSDEYKKQRASGLSDHFKVSRIIKP